MSTDQQQWERFWAQLQETIKTEIDAALTKVANEMDAQRQENERQIRNLVNSAAQHITDTAQKSENQINDTAARVTEKAGQTLTKGIEQITNTANTSITDAAKVSADLVESAGEQMRHAGEYLATGAEKAVTEAEAAGKAKAEAEAAREKAAEEKATAEKATAFMTMAGNAQIQHMTADMHLKAEEKRILDEMKGKRARLEDEWDMEEQLIQSGIQHYYPEMSEELERLKREGAAED